jgi:O-antigen/teichoic acid export membrane protein
MDRRSSLLLLFTATNFVVVYATGVLLARQLGVQRYDEYAVAVASLTILSTLAELGTGKYAMRLLPVLAERGAWGAMRGYRRFATTTVLTASVLLALAFALPQLSGGLDAGLVALAFLPAVALVGYGAEVVQANHATLRAALLARIVVPGLTLAGVALATLRTEELTANLAVALYGAGWLAGLLLLRRFLASTTPPQVRDAAPESTPRSWLVEGLPFLVFALLIVALTKVGLVVFERVAADNDASVYAAVLETGAFLYVFAKSTDKMFLPGISLALERRDAAFLREERRRRLTWMSVVCVVFVGTVVLFGRSILGLYGDAFRVGHRSLVLVSAGTAVWTLFSIAPTYLKYVGRARFVELATAAAVLAHVVLTWLLGRSHGHLGAAVAYALPIALLYGTFAFVARRELHALIASDRTAERSLVDDDHDEFGV